MLGEELAERERDSYGLQESLFLRGISNYPNIPTSGNTARQNVFRPAEARFLARYLGCANSWSARRKGWDQRLKRNVGAFSQICDLVVMLLEFTRHPVPEGLL